VDAAQARAGVPGEYTSAGPLPTALRKEAWMSQQRSSPAPAASAPAVRPDLPTLADLEAATAASQAVLADPAATRADRLAAFEREMAAFDAYELRPGGDAELQADAELEVGI
jgi:hypothetical protein